MHGGYNLKLLRVNLSDLTTIVEKTNEQFCRKYLGGAGFVTYYLWKELKPKIDPLGPENKLVFAVGPLTGIPISGTGRNCIGAKSPLTGGIAKSEVGEFWGVEFKRAGFDILVIEGKAKKPVYLWIHDGEANIKDASGLWGKMTKEAQQAIRDELGDRRIRVAGIGSAAENLVRFACIMNGLYDAAGRGGLGAVMGSKNLKAIAVRGHKSPSIVNPDGVKELRDWLAANFDLLLKSFSTYGTGAPMDAGEFSGNLPVRNFRDGLFPGVELINARVLKDTIRIRMDACFGCTVRCKKVVEVKSPYTVDSAYGGPEYETLAGLGSNCGIDNLAAIAKGNELCNAYSLDTISTGGVVAFAMECFENGLLTTKDTDGLELRFGNAEAMLRVIELISQRKGIGDLLAEGTARAAQKIGRGAGKFTIHSKGLEAGMHEPRLKPGLGLGYMVNPHGADHCTNMHDSLYVAAEQIKELMPLGITEPVPAEDIGPRKVALFRTVQFRQIINDSLVLCSMLPYSFRQIADVTAAVTGWNTGVMEHFRIAERILTMARLFNLREGFEADDDRLPARFFEPKTDGALSNKPLEQAKMEKARSYYYTLMGWNPRTGVPLPEKLEELGIS